MKIDTHLKIDKRLCGTPTVVQKGYARVELTAIPEMAADESGLIHGGFIFGLADYAAMVAVNHPNVVLGAAEVKFLKPVALDESVVAEARVDDTSGKKQIVKVTVARADRVVLEGVFTCFVLKKHVLAMI